MCHGNLMGHVSEWFWHAHVQPTPFNSMIMLVEKQTSTYALDPRRIAMVMPAQQSPHLRASRRAAYDRRWLQLHQWGSNAANDRLLSD
jgi:hypothetical protein